MQLDGDKPHRGKWEPRQLTICYFPELRHEVRGILKGPHCKGWRLLSNHCSGQTTRHQISSSLDVAVLHKSDVTRFVRKGHRKNEGRLSSELYEDSETEI